MVVQNPETGNPPNAGLEEKADFDKRQMHEFKGKRTKGLRWISVQVGGSWLHDAALLDGGRWQAVQTSVEAAAISVLAGCFMCGGTSWQRPEAA